MEFFFHPQAVAVVGATPNKAKGGYAILRNLLNTFTGPIYPVNPHYNEIEGLPCYPAIAAVPGIPDLAILFISADQIISTMEACIDKKIPGVIVQSGGFSEIGGDGERIQAQLSRMSKETGIRIWGPNCMGLVDAKKGFVFSFTDPSVLSGLLKPGPVSLVVQSGMLSAGFIVDLLSHEISGFNKVCSIGNKADVNECDLLDYLLKDPETGVIGYYLESFVDLRRFIAIYQNHRAKKPIVILKGGKSEIGRQAALSHTASLAGDFRILTDVLKQAGIFIAHDFHQLIDLCRTLGMVKFSPVKAPPQIAVLTFSGASGIVAADFMAESGLQVAQLESATKENLSAFFPPWMPPANPVDVWPAMEHHSGKGLDIYSMALEAVLQDPGVDACMIHTFAGFSRVRLNLPEAARISHKWGKPVFIWILGERNQVLTFQVEARNLGIPAYHELFRGVECMAAALHSPDAFPALFCFSETPKLPPMAQIVLAQSGGILDEHVSKTLLGNAGFPVVQEFKCEDLRSCRDYAKQTGFPVVLKGLEPGTIHKSEAGLIKMDIRDESQLTDAFRELKERISGGGAVLLQKQMPGQLELILGYKRDLQYGPCVMVGLGGIFVDTIQDTVFTLAPLTEDRAVSLIGNLRNRNLLQGYRGIPPAPIKTLARYLVMLGMLGTVFPSIREIDINPLILSETGPVIVDATIIKDPS